MKIDAEIHEVSSSLLSALAYDKEKKILLALFRNSDQWYAYFDVEGGVVDGVLYPLPGGSIGQSFITLIKGGNYRYEQPSVTAIRPATVVYFGDSLQEGTDASNTGVEESVQHLGDGPWTVRREGEDAREHTL